MDEIAAQVESRARQIQAMVPITAEQKIRELDQQFALQCLRYNRVGDATLWCALFADKYVWVHEWKKMLKWNGQL